jgi:hypothetical protein
MVGNPVSMESPINMRTPRRSYTVAAAEKKKKVPISKIPVNLGPFPNAKAVRSKMVSGQCGLQAWWEPRKDAHPEAGLQQDAGGPCQSYIGRTNNLDET